MSDEYRIVREFEFCDTDMAGIMHFSNFFRFLEAAEHAFFRSVGFSIHPAGPDAVYWPRVHAGMDFNYPLHFEDSVEIRLLAREKREKSWSIRSSFARSAESRSAMWSAAPWLWRA